MSDSIEMRVGRNSDDQSGEKPERKTKSNKWQKDPDKRFTKESLKKDWAFAGFKQPKDVFKPEYRHVFGLMVLVVNILLFFISERVLGDNVHIVHCEWDDLIPFNEYFILAYVIWYPFWIFMSLYTMCFEVPTFKRLMKFFALTYGISAITFFVWPSGHELWPQEFPRDNFCTWLVQRIYDADLPRSIFPSEHVIGAFAVVFAGADSKRFSSGLSMTLLNFTALMITASICFVKQHSLLDAVAAFPVIALGYFVCFYPERRRRKKAKQAEKMGLEKKP